MWIDMTNPIVGEATKKVAFADAVINNLVHLFANMGGAGGGGGGNLVPNGDFELDANSDGVPDAWDLTEYTAGSFAIDETTPGQGARGIKFTSPGASGGGDLQSTDFFAVGPGKTLCVDFIHWASVAGIHNRVEIRWYSTALEANYISTTGPLGDGNPDIYDSTANPTSIARHVGYATPPSTARFAKLKIIGALNDNATAGVAYFDDVNVCVVTETLGPVLYDGLLYTAGGWELVARYPTTDPMYFDPALLPSMRFAAAITQNGGTGQHAYVRVKIGSNYSNELKRDGNGDTNGILEVSLAGILGTRSAIEIQTNVGSAALGYITVVQLIP